MLHLSHLKPARFFLLSHISLQRFAFMSSHKKPRLYRSSSTSPSAGDRSHLTDKKFQDLPISSHLKKSIKYEQSALSNKDLLVQAKTGTGKTIGFLLPAIEKLLRTPVRPKGASILVLSPTRELAQQISKEANTLLPAAQLRISTVIGGTSNPKGDLAKFVNFEHDIVVATPGRLHDYFTGERRNDVLTKFNGLQTLVLDEVDRLLDGGFARELDGVINMLPHTKRQNLFFSATVSEKIKQVAKSYNNGSEYVFISTLKEDEMNTHEHVHQSYIITPFMKHLPTMLALLHLDSLKHTLQHITTSTPSLSPGSSSPTTKSKVMVFFPTARHVSFAAEVLSEKSIKQSLPPIFEVHSRKSQSARTKAMEAFTKASSAILLCSDVTARGIDIPGVTLVLQMGLPASAEQYVHRLGRTARAGAEGQGIIVLDPAEQSFHSSRDMMKTTTITPYITSPSSHEAKDLATYTETYTQHVNAALSTIDPDTVGRAYSAWLGYYKSNTKTTKWSPEVLVAEATKYARDALGWKGVLPPALLPKTVGMMGLKGVKGLNIARPGPSVQSEGRQRQRQRQPEP